MWKSNSRVSVNEDLFTEWINFVCSLEIKKYLLDLPLRVILVIDNAPVYTKRVQDNILEEFSFIKIVYFPPNTTPILQPMDQQVISNFQKLYTSSSIRRAF